MISGKLLNKARNSLAGLALLASTFVPGCALKGEKSYAGLTYATRSIINGVETVPEAVVQPYLGAVVSHEKAGDFDINFWANYVPAQQTTAEVDLGITKEAEINRRLGFSFAAFHYHVPDFVEAQDTKLSFFTKDLLINPKVELGKYWGENSGHGHYIIPSLNGALPFKKFPLTARAGASYVNDPLGSEGHGWAYGFGELSLPMPLGKSSKGPSSVITPKFYFQVPLQEEKFEDGTYKRRDFIGINLEMTF